ncbi:hypothetical protein O181_006209 [Austropuccinia psidii MF-1]|uniref:Uncharacterized protein n=1 Tax=Austropuccinia psidii MF-1 TaxID=1389203 RepID=A0A9Q3GGM5_9BASI|nr:hypothetical protein [Austropuccinia psidii MF-1]
MTPIRSGHNYSIHSNGYGPGNSSHKSKRQECQPRGEAQMEDAKSSTSSQRSGDIPVSVQELVYGRKAEGVGTSSQLSTQVIDRIVFTLNNDLHHTISRNAEVETAFNFKDITRLEEWPTISGEGEYNDMEFTKTIDMFKEDLSIPDQYISAISHSFSTKS